MRYANGTRLMKWCASGLLVLALSPFTAPFQTVDLGWLLNGSGHDETALVTPLTATLTSVAADDDDDPGSLIAPAGTQLRLEPPFGIAVLTFVVTPSVAFLESSGASVAGISAPTIPPAPLRL